MVAVPLLTKMAPPAPRPPPPPFWPAPPLPPVALPPVSVTFWIVALLSRKKMRLLPPASMVWPLPSMVMFDSTGGSKVVPSAMSFCSRMRSPALAPAMAADRLAASVTVISAAEAGPDTSADDASSSDVNAKYERRRNRRRTR